MGTTSILQFTGLLLICLAAAFVTLALFARVTARPRIGRGGFMQVPPSSTSLLFEDHKLVDGTAQGRQFLCAAPPDGSDWERAMSLLTPGYPTLDAAVADLPENGTVTLTSTDGRAKVTLQWHDGLTRLTIDDADRTDNRAAIDRHRLSAMEQELETLRGMADNAPFLVWRQRSDGTITWANNAYIELAARADPDSAAPSWPPPRLFVTPQSTNDAPSSIRLTTHLPGEVEPRWFECLSTKLGQDRLFTAMAADKIVRAEVSLRDFVQTLTKTFAHLKIGLAIFDKQRRLALFNPALTDLTSLSPEFLARQPTLHAVLDQLREKRMIPEQRDYRSWRQHLSDMEAAAKNGTYEETWTLPTGQTYRITGHPHPDGALAFLMEDVTAEISLTRRFRMELETGQAVLDVLDDAMAVFSSGGTLTVSNAAYARLWGVEPDSTIGNADIVEATRCWGALAEPTPVWGDLRDFISQLDERAEWTAEIQMTDGRALACRVVPLVGGSTLVTFKPQSTPQLVRPSPRIVPVPMILDRVPG